MTDPTRREFLAAAGSAPGFDVARRCRRAARRRACEADERARPAAIPPHRPLAVDGVHAYTDRVSVAAGETIRFHVSSSYPYELQVCRLGTDVDSPDARRRSCIRSAGRAAAVQPIHPGSYLHRRQAARPDDRAARA